MGVIDAPNYYSVVNKLYHDVSDFEESNEPPKVKLDSDTVNFGKISFVISPCRYGQSFIYMSIDTDNQFPGH
jgi:hypothetical protein